LRQREHRALPRSFYARPALAVAPELLGRLLVRDGPRGTVAGRIVEVEAYEGERDPASHAYRGPTPRNEVMFGEPGHLYVYFTYGMHHCLNVVCDVAQRASAVLVRALDPELGIETMRRRRGGIAETSRLARGPGCVAQALGLDRRHNGLDLTRARCGSPARRPTGAAGASFVARGSASGSPSAAAGGSSSPGTPRCRVQNRVDTGRWRFLVCALFAAQLVDRASTRSVMGSGRIPRSTVIHRENMLERSMMGLRVSARLGAWFVTLALVIATSPAFAQSYEDPRLPVIDPSYRDPRLLGMGRLNVSIDDVHTRVDLWEFARNPAGTARCRQQLDARVLSGDLVPVAGARRRCVGDDARAAAVRGAGPDPRLRRLAALVRTDDDRRRRQLQRIAHRRAEHDRHGASRAAQGAEPPDLAVGQVPGARSQSLALRAVGVPQDADAHRRIPHDRVEPGGRFHRQGRHDALAARSVHARRLLGAHSGR
jgi:DNA-3-methyladenine glycosylase